MRQIFDLALIADCTLRCLPLQHLACVTNVVSMTL